jgi:hypothetical protein
MEIFLKEINNSNYAVVEYDGLVINDLQDSLDIMADCSYQGAIGMIVKEKNIHPDFFRLSTGFAGEILQKFSNYNFKLAIIGDFSKYTSKSLHDFIYESNKGNTVFFVDSISHAEKLFG